MCVDVGMRATGIERKSCRKAKFTLNPIKKYLIIFINPSDNLFCFTRVIRHLFSFARCLINAFVYERVKSKSRIIKIRQNLSNLYIRVSTAVHSEVSAEEEKSLFLNTYLILGEILHIEKIK